MQLETRVSEVRLTGPGSPVTACVTEAPSAPSVSDSSLQEAGEAAQVKERLDSVQVSNTLVL